MTLWPTRGRWLNEASQRLVEAVCLNRFPYNAITSKKANNLSRASLFGLEASFAEELRDFLLRAVGTHKLVLMGEVHHRPRYWEFNQLLVREKAFTHQVGVIYLELPSNDQALVEQFLAGPKCDPQPIIEMLRDIRKLNALLLEGATGYG